MNEPTNLADWYVIPLAEVAKRTGWSERSLTEDCRAGDIDHVNRKGTYGFTPKQVDALIARYTRKGTTETVSKAQQEADELAAARAFNAGNGRRAA